MRIWILPSAFYPSLGGIEELTRALAGKLLDGNDTVEVLTNRCPAALAAEEDVEGLQVRRIPMPAPRASVAAMLRYRYEARQVHETLAKLADSFRPQIINGFDLLIRAWSRVPEATLSIAREGPISEDLHHLAVPFGDRICFLGRLDRKGVQRALKGSLAVVTPSRLEPFGIVALEATAAGRPVAASNIGGAPEFLVGGFLVDPNDEKALADAVRQALAHSEIGVEGKRAAAAYDWNVLVQRWREVYGRMLGQRVA